MVKKIKLPEFEKGEIAALKRVRQIPKEISKALKLTKAVICNYLKVPNKYGRRNRLKFKQRAHAKLNCLK